jgi:hypothetical protein
MNLVYSGIVRTGFEDDQFHELVSIPADVESIFKSNVIVNRRRMANRTLQRDGFHLRSDAKAATGIEDYSSISRTQLVFGVWRTAKCRLLPR